MLTTLLVCGGRDYVDHNKVFSTLNRINREVGIKMIIHGDCPTGADYLCKLWAEDKNICQKPIPAQWDVYGKRAGPIRNQEMLDLYGDDIDHVLAFPGGSGTEDMISRSIRYGLDVTWII